MTQIVLTAEQSALFAKAEGPVVLVNDRGQTVGRAEQRFAASKYFTAEEIAGIEAKIGKDGPYVTTAELLERLKKLDAKR